ncbi:MAG: glycine cleavage system protein GcvH [Halanaerobiales bacterium]|nr:glycine cleavage system protein GcvH [Halanaerobiales bacterium]
MRLERNLKYTKEHEWLRVEGEEVFIGITDFAQHQLGDIVFVELPEVGDEFSISDSFAVVDSVKATSDVYMPFDCKILEANEKLVDSPERINEEPYENWMIKVKPVDLSQLDEMLDVEEYEKFCAEEE